VFAPVPAQPAHIFLDRPDVLVLFPGRIGIVEAQVANAAGVLGRNPEVQAYALGVADMQISVRLRRKPGHYPPIPFVRRQVVGNNLPNEINSCVLFFAHLDIEIPE
jgi:hypothetical protein